LPSHRLHDLLMCAHNKCPQVDPAVSAAVHYVSSLYYKAGQDFAEFYKSSLQYLAFVSSDQLEHEFKLVRTWSAQLLWTTLAVFVIID
jgi:hypothetical protein